jgi:MFS family permease
MAAPSWMNRTVVGAGLTSFFADVGYELATALLPSFLLILGLPVGYAAQVLGAIEAAAEFLSNAAKLLVGWWSDRIGRRKALVVFGYALTGSAFALCAIAVAWPLVLAAKSLAWLGKGIRGPLRNAIITDSVDPAHRGKAFGFHRAGDTLGAVLGPLIAAGLLWNIGAAVEPRETYALAFWFTLVPGLGAALTFALLVREQRFTPKPGLRLGASLAAMPRGYRHFLFGVGLFGLGDFSHTLLILAATAHLTNDLLPAAVLGILLYAWRNLVQAVAAFPAGWLGDRCGHTRVLVAGYVAGAGTMIGFAVLIAVAPTWLPGWIGCFALAGIYMAIQESLEPAIVAELVPDKSLHGTAYGALAVVNGLGDVGASLAVGALVLTFGWSTGLLYAAAMMIAGAAALWWMREKRGTRHIT